MSFGIFFLDRQTANKKTRQISHSTVCISVDCLERPAEQLVLEKIRALNWSNDDLLLPVSLPIITTTTMSPGENPTTVEYILYAHGRCTLETRRRSGMGLYYVVYVFNM